MEKINLFCGINSLGMPFTRENKQHLGYFDIIKQKLIEEGYEVDGINISSLNKNHTWDLEKILNYNYNLSKIKNIQMLSIDGLRNANILFKLVVPKEFKNRYREAPGDENKTFKDIYTNSENPKFIYSAGTNDFFTYIQAGPVELLDENVRKKVPENLNDLVIQSVKNVEKNLLLLKDLNKDVEIFVLGFYYSPLFDKIQRVIYLQEKVKDKTKKYKNKFAEVINLYNMLLEEMCNKYDFVKFIDLSFMTDYCAPLDFHPNTKGNELIATEIMNKLNKNEIKGRK